MSIPVQKTCCGVVVGFVVLVMLVTAHYGIWMYAAEINDYQIRSMEAELRKANPGFGNIEYFMTSRSPWDYLKEYPKKPSLDSVRDFTFLPQIMSIIIDDMPVSDLSPIKRQRFRGISLIGTEVKDLSPLKRSPLKYVSLPTGLPSLNGLQGSKLTELHVAHGTFSDLHEIQGLPLEELALYACALTDISALRGMPLRELTLVEAPLVNIEPLRGLPLERLSLADTLVADLSPLVDSQTLWRLDLRRTKVTCLSGLKGLNLYHLNLGETDVEDLTPLKGMPLDLLRLKGTKVTDLTPLSGMPLTWLDIGDTMVSDLSPLRGIKGIRIFIENTPAAEGELPDWLFEGNVIVK